MSRLFCFCEKSEGQQVQKLNVMEIGLAQEAQKPFKRSSSIELPNADDYPVIMKDCPQSGMLFIITKMGHVLVYEISQVAFIYRKQLTDFHCFQAVPTPEANGLITIDTSGRIFSIDLKLDSLLSFIFNDLTIARSSAVPSLIL